MKKILAIARYTFIENIRQKIFYSLFIFAPVIFAASWVLSGIGGEQRLRVLEDFGFTLAYFAALFTAVFVGATFIYDEIENKSIYMILARPVSKFSYILGRYIGFLSASVSLLFFMTLLTLAVVKISGGAVMSKNLVTPLLDALKIAAILSVSLFFAMLTTSRSASMIFAVFFMIAGYFTQELEFLSRLAASPAVKILSFLMKFLAPQLYRFDIPDLPSQSAALITLRLAGVSLYTLIYSAAFLVAAYIIFRRKEF